ncbi:fungal specific transcription factor [Cordyceps javanica]|uniref:Fungal specific transcription factor n=1 Tax=Cordyceps javanica TaxID=43265 RepID=A0A545VML5_9HYPO|nr:fungal specific transcription factor [Cordyceps javanica]TQW02941.1 fungal specific transcription factor [Cordyceps javanica]
MSPEIAWSDYLDRLRRDSEELTTQRSLADNAHNRADQDQSAARPASINLEDTSPNKPTLVEDTAINQGADSVLPIYIGETACTAFAARVCQCLNGAASPTHPLQWNYVDEAELALLLNADVPWPSLAQARLWVQTALAHTNPAFHVALRKDTLLLLTEVYQRRRFDNATTKSKYFALFALGQLYASHLDPSQPHVPGSAYFAQALRLVHIPPERPSLMYLEAILSVALFYQHLNRFHSAYLLVGNALRLGLSFRLNYPSANEGLSDVDREHRVRLWWSIYAMDRFWGLRSGLPVQVSDGDVHVGIPRDPKGDEEREQFCDPAHQIAGIGLARLAGNISQDLYGLRKSDESFMQQEQKLLTRSKQWVEGLPNHLKLQQSGTNSKNVIVMHLQFNYPGVASYAIYENRVQMQCNLCIPIPVGDLGGMCSRR